MKPLIIGSTDLQNLNEASKCLIETCEELDLAYHIRQISQSQLDQLVLDNIDCLALPLIQVSLTRDESIVIAGLSAREHLSLKIISAAHNIDSTQVLKLKSDKAIGVLNSGLRDQISTLYPRHQVMGFDTNAALTKALVDKSVDAIAGWNLKEMDGFELSDLGCKEILPEPGQGVYAYLSARNDLKSRKDLQEIHETEVAYCTNVERKILKFLGADSCIGAHCTIDRMGNYHLDVFARENDGYFKKIKLSQSTFVQLAENACRKLNYEVSDI